VTIKRTACSWRHAAYRGGVPLRRRCSRQPLQRISFSLAASWPTCSASRAPTYDEQSPTTSQTIRGGCRVGFHADHGPRLIAPVAARELRFTRRSPAYNSMRELPQTPPARPAFLLRLRTPGTGAWWSRALGTRANSTRFCVDDMSFRRLRLCSRTRAYSI